jgi:hypothetical protein
MSWYFIKRHSGNVKNNLLAAIFQHPSVVFANMGKVAVFEAEGLVLTESADVAHTVNLHLVVKPFVDITKVRGIAVGKRANVRAEVSENVPSPHPLVLELLDPKAKWAFDFLPRSRPQLVERWNSDSGRGIQIAIDGAGYRRV